MALLVRFLQALARFLYSSQAINLLSVIVFQKKPTSNSSEDKNPNLLINFEFAKSEYSSIYIYSNIYINIANIKYINIYKNINI